MKNVLHIFVNAFYSNGKSISGGDKRIVEFLNKWNKADKDIELRLYSTQRFYELLNNDDLNKVKFCDTSEPEGLSKRLILTYIYRTITVTKKIACNNDDCNIFYSSSDFFPDIIPARKSARKYKGKWYATVHHIIESPKTRPGNKLRNIIAYLEQQAALKMIIKDADRILVVSPLVRDYFIKQGVSSDRISMVLNGVDTDFINSVDESNVPEYDGVFFARLAPSKGIYELPDIWAKVCDKIPDAKLAIIGGGSEQIKKELSDLFEQKGTGHNIKILGYLESDVAYALMKRAKVFVFPSHEEGWGITIAEAMACKLPVVSYKLPVFKYIFPNLLMSVEMGDTDSFSSEIIRLLQDDSKRMELADRGYQYTIDNYTWKKAADLELKALGL